MFDDDGEASVKGWEQQKEITKEVSLGKDESKNTVSNWPVFQGGLIGGLPVGGNVVNTRYVNSGTFSDLNQFFKKDDSIYIKAEVLMELLADLETLELSKSEVLAIIKDFVGAGMVEE